MERYPDILMTKTLITIILRPILEHDFQVCINLKAILEYFLTTQLQSWGVSKPNIIYNTENERR